MSTELATAHVSLYAETSHLASDAAQALDRVGRDARQALGRAFDQAGSDLRRTLGQAGGQAGGDLSQALGRAGQSAGQAGGRAAARGFSSQLNQIDASAFNSIARGAEGAGEEIQRLNRWQLNDLIREANRAGQQLGTEIPAGASNAERALRRLDAQGLENLLRSAREAQRALGRVDDEAAQATRSSGSGARAAGEESGQQAAEGMGDRFANLLGGKAGIIGGAVAAAFSLAGVTAAGLFVKALQSGMEREKVLDLTQARLGIDDATMGKIGLAAGQAYAGNFGESVASNIDAARRAIQGGLLDSSATAQETQQVIAQLTSVSDLMGEEIPAVARAAGQAIKTGIAGNATEAFDLFAAAERNGLNVSEDFLDTITEYGTQFRKLGLTGPEAVGLINQAVRAGARDADIAADAFKEFSIRVVDGSKSTSEAYKTLGLDSERLTGQFVNGGGEARDAMTEVFVALNKIEDPVKANEIALSLFGTQVEDLGAAFHAFNLDTAADSLGKVAGAAQGAINTIGDNAAGKIESAKRSIEISTDAIGSALAKAFGPELAKLADWVTTHQPQILDGLGKLADGAFVTADAFLSFTSLTLDAFADWADGAGGAVNSVVGPLGSVAAVIGRLTGSSELEDLGNGMRDLDDKFHSAATTARDLAAGIEDGARPALDRMREGVASNIEKSVMAAQVFQALGATVTALPDGHDIILKDNTPEVTQRLEALGLKVTTGLDGQVRVTANTAEAQRLYDAFVAQLTGREVPVTARVTFLDANGSVTSDPAKQTVHVPGGRFASGGVVPGLATGGRAGRTLEGRLWGPGTGTSDDILGLGLNGIPTALVSAGEGVVRTAAMALGGDKIVAALNAGWRPPADFLGSIARGGARLFHGQYDGSLRGLGLEEDNPLIAGAIGLRNLLYKGDYDGNLNAVGLGEDNPLISAILGGRSLAHGDYDGRLREFGIEEDNPLVAGVLGAGGLLRGNYDPNLRQFGIEEDNPLVDAGIGAGGLMNGDYKGNLRRFGIEEDNPLVGAAFGMRKWLADLPGFADGGQVPGKRFAQSMDPAKYSLGGFSTSAIDCSGMVSATINDALGLGAFSSRMATASEGQWLAAKGGLPGLGGPGDISVGWVNGGPGGGHTAMTLGDGTNVESNGMDGVVIGGPVGAADAMFTQKMHIPAALLRGGDLAGGSSGAAGSGGAGASGGGGASAGGLGGAAAGAGGGTFGGVTVPQGVTPVWIIGGNASTGTASASTQSATPSESFAPQSDTAGVQTMDQVLASIPGRAAKAGQGFLDANVDGLLGDLGMRRTGGAAQALASQLFELVTSAMQGEIKKAFDRQGGAASRFSGGR